MATDLLDKPDTRDTDTDQDDDMDHVVCEGCDPLHTLCGLPIAGMAYCNRMSCDHIQCIVCADLENMHFAPKCLRRER
jgi:hypothetical protein